MDSQQVCRLLDVSKRTLQSYRDKGLIPYSSVGGKFFYRQKDMADYMLARTVRKGVK